MKTLTVLAMILLIAGCDSGRKADIQACAVAIEAMNPSATSSKCDGLPHDDQLKAAHIASAKNGVIVFLPPYEAKTTSEQSSSKDDPKPQPSTFKEIRDLAMEGDYQAQRNLAYGYSSRQYPGQEASAMLACAWRIVIIKSGSEKVNETDVGNHDLYCNKLDKTSRSAAEAQAANILRQKL